MSRIDYNFCPYQIRLISVTSNGKALYLPIIQVFATKASDLH